MRYDGGMDQAKQIVDVAVLGVGRMGRHHARTYAQMPQANLVGVVDFDPTRVKAVADEYGCAGFPSVEALLEKHPDLKAATVAVPTQYHTAAAKPLLERGIACLVEKPIAASVAEAEALAALARKHKAVLQIGHTERFNPVVRALSALKLTPRFMRVTRVSPMTFRSMDVGVVMDMMIHDLDIIISLVGRPLAQVDAVGVSVLGRHEDLCDARLTFEGGCVVNIVGSRLATATQRTLQLFSEQASVSLDYGSRTGTVIRLDTNRPRLDSARADLSSGKDLSNQNYLDMLATEPLTIDLPPNQQDPLTAQATAFLNAARTGGVPIVTAEQGCAAVDAAERIVASIKSQAWDGLDLKAFEGRA